MLYTYINRHTRPPNATKTKDNTVELYIIKKVMVVIIYGNNVIES